ncbi:hypothetical protein NDU88_009121 [Pleurodeles waltl]|uniref:Uncharacterized protein n=1 Tax=Pleurodeles waltl TaxID=8319 RepID=A0AAV7RVA0_PLEWA|nr:hypothetical protein NDU88_009121 [Pleurodeles waltl]
MALTQQYPRGTITSSLPDPDAIPTSSNPATHPGDGGICKSFLDETWAAAPARTPREAAGGGTRPGEVRRTVRVSTFTADSWPRKQDTTTAVSSLIQRPENQEATTPENRPRSGESHALGRAWPWQAPPATPSGRKKQKKMNTP